MSNLEDQEVLLTARVTMELRIPAALIKLVGYQAAVKEYLEDLGVDGVIGASVYESCCSYCLAHDHTDCECHYPDPD